MGNSTQQPWSVFIAGESMTKIFLTDEAAEILRCSTRHVRNLIRSGSIKAFSVGSGVRASYRISEADLNAFIASGSQQTTPAEHPAIQSPMILSAGSDFAKAVRRFSGGQ